MSLAIAKRIEGSNLWQMGAASIAASDGASCASSDDSWEASAASVFEPDSASMAMSDGISFGASCEEASGEASEGTSLANRTQPVVANTPNKLQNPPMRNHRARSSWSCRLDTKRAFT